MITTYPLVLRTSGLRVTELRIYASASADNSHRMRMPKYPRGVFSANTGKVRMVHRLTKGPIGKLRLIPCRHNVIGQDMTKGNEKRHECVSDHASYGNMVR